MSESIQEQRKVEGFGDSQYTCSEEELKIRLVIYSFFQNSSASGMMRISMTQDWQGNILRVEGEFRPMLLAKKIIEALTTENENGKVDVV